MNILLSIFAISLLGTTWMIFYKVMSLRKRENIAVSPQTLEHHVGSFFRKTISGLATLIKQWYKDVCVPFALDIMRVAVIAMIRFYRKAHAFILRFIESRRKEGEVKKGAASFFLKDISEHKKNLKNGDHV